MNRKRVILTSCSIILLCTAILVGVTFALFNEQVALTNHLKAGDLNITLTRTELEYKTLDDKGYLNVVKTGVSQGDDPVDFTTTTNADKNVFDITDDTLIAPGSYFKSVMKIKNEGNVAFTYEVGLKLNASETGLNIAKQMLITVTDTEGNLLIEKPMLLDAFPKDGTTFTLVQGEVAAFEEDDDFVVTVKFLDADNAEDKAYLGEGVINNTAMNEIAKFDLQVVAVQKTTTPEVSAEETSADASESVNSESATEETSENAEG